MVCLAGSAPNPTSWSAAFRNTTLLCLLDSLPRVAPAALISGLVLVFLAAHDTGIGTDIITAQRSSKIGFTSNRERNFEVYTMNPDGTGVVRVTSHPIPYQTGTPGTALTVGKSCSLPCGTHPRLCPAAPSRFPTCRPI